MSRYQAVGAQTGADMGTVTVEDGKVTAHTVGGSTVLDEAIAQGFGLPYVLARDSSMVYRLIGDEEESEESGADDLDKALAAARTRTRRRRPGDIVRRGIADDTEIEFTGTGLISKADDEQEDNVVADKSGDVVDPIEEPDDEVKAILEMKKMAVFVMHKRLGTVTLNDEGVIVAHDTGDELLDDAVYFKQTPRDVQSHARLMGFSDIDDEVVREKPEGGLG